MAEGQPPKKYGLYIPPKKPTLKPTPSTANNIFGDEDDQARPTAAPVVDIKKRQIEKLQQKALEEDSSVFLYDEVVHEEPARKQIKGASLPPGMSKSTPSGGPQTKTEQPKSRYMDALLQKAEERKALNEVVRVRLMKKEAELDADKYQDKEVIMTAAYKKKLEAMKDQMELADKEIDEDVTKRKDMSGFYGNLMTKNVAFGSGTGGRIREQQKSKPLNVSGPKRYGLDVPNPPSQESRVQDDEEEESFGPVRRK